MIITAWAFRQDDNTLAVIGHPDWKQRPPLMYPTRAIMLKYAEKGKLTGKPVKVRVTVEEI